MTTKSSFNEVLVIDGLEALQLFAKSLVEKLQEAGRLDVGCRLLILLDGPMGAGKTELTRFIVQAMGGQQVASPSFALHHEYVVKAGRVQHFDLFRIDGADDLESTGFWDVFEGGPGVVMIEWADRLRDFGLGNALPRTWFKLSLRLEALTGDQRRISLRVTP